MKPIALIAALVIAILGYATAPADEPHAPVAHPVKKLTAKQCNKLADDHRLAVGSKERADYIRECRTRRAPAAPPVLSGTPPPR